MVKAIFFDIDGTLIPIGQHKMPQDTIDALKQLKKKGIKIFIATGRAMNELNIITDTISFDGYITLNGQVCLNEDYEVFYGNPIPLKDLNVLVELFSEKKLPVVMVEKDKYYINYMNEEVIAIQNEIGVDSHEIEPYAGNPIYQVIVYADLQMTEKLFEKLPGCKWSRWHPNGIDVFSKNGGKMTGIEKTLEYFGISQDETMAFGDGDNDAEMLRYVKMGVAMGNAVDTTKAAADYVTSSQDNGGIFKALKHFGLI